MDITIAPVTSLTIDDALKLIYRVFPNPTEEENPDLWFRMSIEPERYAEKIKQLGTKDVRYFVAIEPKSKKVIGTTGLYHLLEDRIGVVWLGWYCVDPEFQKKGIGTYILQWTIMKAKEEGNQYLQLYTWPDENRVAQHVYDKFGFETTAIKQDSGIIVAYKKLEL